MSRPPRIQTSPMLASAIRADSAFASSSNNASPEHPSTNVVKKMAFNISKDAGQYTYPKHEPINSIHANAGDVHNPPEYDQLLSPEDDIFSLVRSAPLQTSVPESSQEPYDLFYYQEPTASDHPHHSSYSTVYPYKDSMNHHVMHPSYVPTSPFDRMSVSSPAALNFSTDPVLYAQSDRHDPYATTEYAQPSHAGHFTNSRPVSNLAHLLHVQHSHHHQQHHEYDNYYNSPYKGHPTSPIQESPPYIATGSHSGTPFPHSPMLLAPTTSSFPNLPSPTDSKMRVLPMPSPNRTFSRRTTTQHNCSCRQCHVKLAVVYLRSNSAKAIDMGSLNALYCLDCQEKVVPSSEYQQEQQYHMANSAHISSSPVISVHREVPEGLMMPGTISPHVLYSGADFGYGSQEGHYTSLRKLSTVSLSKKRRRTLQPVLDIKCDVCHKKLANGEVLTINSEGIKKSKDGEVEIVCTSCESLYLFCSECGGGRAHRTGKWRPKELFELGRKTCCLPHIRIGTSVASHHVHVLMDNSMNLSLLSILQDIYLDIYLNAQTTTAELEWLREAQGLSSHDTFNACVMRMKQAWEQSTLSVMLTPPRYGFVRFVSLSSIDKKMRNRLASTSVSRPPGFPILVAGPSTATDLASSSAESSASGNNEAKKEHLLVKDMASLESWIARLESRGILPGGLAVSAASVDALNVSYVGYTIAELNLSNGIMVFRCMCPRAVASKSTEEWFGQLIKATIDAAERESQKQGGMQIRSVWCWLDMHQYHSSGAGGDSIRHLILPQRLGFTKVDHVQFGGMMDAEELAEVMGALMLGVNGNNAPPLEHYHLFRWMGKGEGDFLTTVSPSLILGQGVDASSSSSSIEVESPKKKLNF